MEYQQFSAGKAISWAFGRLGEDFGYCLSMMFAVELCCVAAGASIAFHGALAAQLILQLDGVPADSYIWLFALGYGIARLLAQPFVSRWLLLLHDGRKLTFDELLGFDVLYNFPAIAKTTGASVVFFLFTLFGSLILFVPGLFVNSTLRFYKFLIVDRDMDAVEGLRDSYHLSGEHKGQLIVLNLICQAIKAAGLLLLGVGYIPATAACGLAEAYAYKTLLESAQE